MQDIHNQIFNEKAIKYLIDLEKRYEEAFQISVEGKVFRLEEELYKYIIRNFPNYWQF